MIKQIGWVRLVSLVLVIACICMLFLWFDRDEWLSGLRLFAMYPQWVLIMFILYLLSFVLKAAAWCTYLGSGKHLSVCFHGLNYSLLVNHLLPLKAGDIVRAGLLTKAINTRWDEALHSVAVMRLLDMLVLAFIAGAGILWLGLPHSWLWILILLTIILIMAVGFRHPSIGNIPFIRKHLSYFSGTMLSFKGLFIMTMAALSWVLEAGVIYGVARIFSMETGAAGLLWANSMTIAGQVFHITPGAVGTYESTMSASLVMLGISGKEALRAAVLSHTFKFVYAYGMGIGSLICMPVGWREAKAWIQEKKMRIKE